MNTAMKSSVLVLLLLAMMACGSAAYYHGRRLYDHGQYDDAVTYLQKARDEKPKDLKIETTLVRAKLAASQKHQMAANIALARQDYQTALNELQKTLAFDPSNQKAQDDLERVVKILSEAEQKARQSKITIDEMKEQADTESQGRLLDPASNIPLVLKFTNTPVKTILDAISKASGVNFIYDERADTQKKVTIDFSNVRMEQVLDYLMLQTKHFYQVLDSHTLIIIPDNKQKRDEYEQQVMRTFYLSNADAKDVFQLVRSILQTRKMAMSQDLNSITIKDTPEMVALAQRIIEANDKSKGEVAVDVELIEVNSNWDRNLGVDLSSHAVTVMPRYNALYGGTNNQGPPLPSGQYGRALHDSMYLTPLPNFLVNFLLKDSDTQVLARPQLRVMEGKKASVHIGDKEPIPTANLSYPTTGTGTTYVPMTSYTYQDIGVKIDIEPKVHHNREITIKLKAEVSNVTGTIPASGYTPAQPIIGTREITTEIRLEDGETSLLAGLIRKEDTTSYSGLPGLGEVPFLRRLFGNTEKKKVSTDVVVLLTPHIIRMPNITDQDLRALWVGTEQAPKLQGFRESSFAPSPFEAPATTPAPSPAPSPSKEKEKPSPEPPKPAPDGAATAPAPAPAPAQQPQAANVPAELPQPPDQTPAPGGQARILVSPTSLQTAPGGTVVLNMVVVGAKDARGLKMEVDYPTDVLAFQGADEGTFFKMGGGSSSFEAHESKPGTLVVDTGRADDGTSSGSGLLLRLRFSAAKNGVARVNMGTGAITDGAGANAALPPVSSVITVSGGGGAPPSKP
jgi:general secretion pathway protein D